MANVIKEILAAISVCVNQYYSKSRSFFKQSKPVLRALSPLAEGCDRIFAQQALDLKFHLSCPMPFFREEYENDFKPPNAMENNSLDRFRGLLERARKETSLSVFELDGSRADSGEAYGAAGRVVLNQSDILMVIWDGETLGKHGGTEETMAEARRQGVPLIWIDAHGPHDWQLIDVTDKMPKQTKGKRLMPSQVSSTTFVALRETVEKIIRIPEKRRIKSGKSVSLSHDHTTTYDYLSSFFSEKKPFFNWGEPWKLFKGFVADLTLPKLSPHVVGFENSVVEEWPKDMSTSVAMLIDQLRPFYAWADKLAVAYGNTYRSAFTVCYLLAALAVGMALGPVAFNLIDGLHHPMESLFVIGECIVIIWILAIVGFGRWRKWHERWIDYRLIGELVRHVRLVVPLGGGRSFPQLPAHLSAYGHPAGTWMAWYVRAMERQLDQPKMIMDPKHLGECLAQIKSLLEGQIVYHRENAERCHLIENRLHKAGILLMGMTLGACLLHAFTSTALPHWVGLILIFFCGFFPALGAAIDGINNQGEFRRMEKRSAAMSQQLPTLILKANEIEEKLRTSNGEAEPLLSVQAALLANNAAPAAGKRST